MFDCRAAGDSSSSFKSWKVSGEVEKVVWNHFDPFQFFVATDSGHAHMIDVRNDSRPVWTLSAHSEGINGMVLSTQCPGCLVTVSTDETLKVI